MTVTSHFSYFQVPVVFFDRKQLHSRDIQAALLVIQHCSHGESTAGHSQTGDVGKSAEMAWSCAVAKDIGRTLLDVAGIAAAFCKVKLTVGVRPTDSQFVRWSRYLNLDLASWVFLSF